jgi:sulfur-oxidizing protein SoxZ
VLNAVWHPGISANPYTSFFVVAEKSGSMDFTWTDDAGKTYTKTATVTVG